MDAGGLDASALDAGAADRAVQAADAPLADLVPRDTAAAPDLGSVDVGQHDAAAQDATSAVDATLVADAASFDASSPVTGLTARHWSLTFVDEFRGKPSTSARDTYCYDTLPPRCAVWPGSDGNACATPWGGGGPVADAYFAPLRENMAAAVGALDSSRDWSTASFDEVQARYAALVEERSRHLDKCVWTSYQQLNWWGTDYQGSWSTRHDATRVLVDPAGKGYLHLSAVHAPVQASCVYGGLPSGPGDVNCQLKALDAGVLVQGVDYWVDPDPRWPGVYYAGVDGGCPFGGSGGSPNCQVHAFATAEIEPGPAYWVDADPRWPGVYYAGVDGGCPFGGSGGSPNCQLLAFADDVLEDGVDYWVDPDPRWPGVYYEPDFR